jgi:hypothetical protein
MKVEATRPILLWLKKVNTQRRHSIYATKHAVDVLEGGQSELFPRAEILVLGYTIKRDRMGILRVSINPPCGAKGRPEWWIDVSALPSTKLHKHGSRVEIKVHRSRQEKFGI